MLKTNQYSQVTFTYAEEANEIGKQPECIEREVSPMLVLMSWNPSYQHCDLGAVLSRLNIVFLLNLKHCSLLILIFFPSFAEHILDADNC